MKDKNKRKGKDSKPIMYDSLTVDQYKQKTLALLRDNATASNYRMSRIKESYDYFFGKGVSEKYNNLLKFHEIEGKTEGVTPFEPVNFDSISQKVMMMCGELNNNGFELSVNSMDVSSIKERSKFRNQLLFLMQMQSFYQTASEFTGVEFGINDNIPKTDEELDDYMDDFKLAHELVLEAAMEDSVSSLKYMFERKNYMIDLLTSNEVHGMIEKIDGIDGVRRVNPLSCIYDLNTHDDRQSKRNFFIEAEYFSVPSVLSEYAIEKERLEQMMENYRNSTSNYKGVMSTGEADGMICFPPFDGKSKDNYDKVLVVRAIWLDSEMVHEKTTYDKKGNMHVHNFIGKTNKAKLSTSEKKDSRNSTYHTSFEVVRSCTIIGGDEVVEYGRLEDTFRDYEHPHKTKLGVVSVIHNYNNMTSVSLVDRLKEIDDLKNYILTIAQKEITTSMGNVLYVDKARIDKDTYGKGPEAVKLIGSIAKGRKLIVGDSSKGGIGKMGMTDGLPARVIDSSESGLVMQCINYALFLEDQGRKIVGFNDSRQGAAPERQLASVDETKLTQSGHMTNTYFQSMNLFEVLLFEQLGYSIAQTLDKDKEKRMMYANHLGITDETKLDNMDFRKYKIGVNVYPISRQALYQAAGNSLSQGQLQMHEWMEIQVMASKSGGLSKAIRKYIRITKKRAAAQEEARRQEILAQQQQQQIKDKMELDKIVAAGNVRNQGIIQKQGMANEALLDSTKLKVGQEDRKQAAFALAGSRENLRER